MRRPRRPTNTHTRRSSSNANERKFWGNQAAVTSALSGAGRPLSATETTEPNGTAGANGASRSPEAGLPVEATTDPTAMIRSLGPPPLAGHETVAEHYFAAVYDKAVGLAGALAAAAGLTAITGNGGGGADTGADDEDPADD